MSNSIIHAIFPSHDTAGGALEALNGAGVSAKRVSIVGQDGDAFRFATAPVHAKKLDSLIIVLSLIGSVAGTVAGVIGMPTVTGETLTFVAQSGAMGAFSGAVLGMLTGAMIGAVLHLDNWPATDARVRMGTVEGGAMAVSVAAGDVPERESIKSLLLSHGARTLSIDLVCKRR